MLKAYGWTSVMRLLQMKFNELFPAFFPFFQYRIRTTSRYIKFRLFSDICNTETISKTLSSKLNWLNEKFIHELILKKK